MSRDMYGQGPGSGGMVQRSPKPNRRLDMPGYSQSPPVTTKIYPSASISQPPSARASPVSGRPMTSPSQPRKGRHYGISRSSNSSPLTLPPDHNLPHSYSSSGFADGYYVDDPMMDHTRVGGVIYPPPGTVQRSRSATRAPTRSAYQVSDRDAERDVAGIGRDRSLERVDIASRHANRVRERSLDRAFYRNRDDVPMPDPYRTRETVLDGVDPYRNVGGGAPPPSSQILGSRVSGVSQVISNSQDTRHNYPRDNFVMELQSRLGELQSQYGNVKRELDETTNKLGSSMHSIKTFWSPELKKERALRKEEAAKYGLINDQMKMLRNETQLLDSSRNCFIFILSHKNHSNCEDTVYIFKRKKGNKLFLVVRKVFS